jgi:hypothetical protein
MLIWQLGAEFLAISAKMAYYLISENEDNTLFMGKLRFFARLARPLHIEHYAFGLKLTLKLALFCIITVFYAIFLEI